MLTVTSSFTQHSLTVILTDNGKLIWHICQSTHHKTIDMTDFCILHALLLYYMGHCLLQLCLINHFSWTVFDLLCFH